MRRFVQGDTVGAPPGRELGQGLCGITNEAFHDICLREMKLYHPTKDDLNHAVLLTKSGSTTRAVAFAISSTLTSRNWRSTWSRALISPS